MKLITNNEDSRVPARTQFTRANGRNGGVSGRSNDLMRKMLDRSMQSNNLSTSKISIRYTLKEDIDRCREVDQGEIGVELCDHRSHEFVIT